MDKIKLKLTQMAAGLRRKIRIKDGAMLDASVLSGRHFTLHFTPPWLSQESVQLHCGGLRIVSQQIQLFFPVQVKPPPGGRVQRRVTLANITGEMTREKKEESGGELEYQGPGGQQEKMYVKKKKV